MILTITGPSGVGKTTLLKNLLQSFHNARPLESVTTRAPRITDERNFVYIAEDEFTEMEEHGEFLWTVNPHGKRYGTRTKAIDDALRSHESFIALLVLDAVQKLHSYTKTSVKSIYVGISDEKELRKRFQERGDTSREEIDARIIECRSWDAKARESEIPFIYLDGKKSRQELLQEALEKLGNQ